MMTTPPVIRKEPVPPKALAVDAIRDPPARLTENPSLSKLVELTDMNLDDYFTFIRPGDTPQYYIQRRQLRRRYPSRNSTAIRQRIDTEITCDRSLLQILLARPNAGATAFITIPRLAGGQLFRGA